MILVINNSMGLANCSAIQKHANLLFYARYLPHQTCPIMTGICQTKPVLLWHVFAKPKSIQLCQVFATPNLSYYDRFLPNQTCPIMSGICHTKPVLLCQVFAKPNLSCYAKYLLRFSSIKILRSNFKTFFIVIIVWPISIIKLLLYLDL